MSKDRRDAPNACAFDVKGDDAVGWSIFATTEVGHVVHLVGVYCSRKAAMADILRIGSKWTEWHRPSDGMGTLSEIFDGWISDDVAS